MNIYDNIETLVENRTPVRTSTGLDIIYDKEDKNFKWIIDSYVDGKYKTTKRKRVKFSASALVDILK